jgi:hypothetical protein
MPQALKPPEPAPTRERKQPPPKPARPPKPPKPAKVAKAPKAAKPKAPPKPKAPKPVKPKAPAKPGEPAKAGGRNPLLVGVIAAAVVAAVLGLLIGRSGGGGEGGAGAPTAVQANADLEAKFPTGWSKSSSAPEIPGMAFTDAVAMSPKGADASPAIVFGQVREGAANSTLLPAGFREALGGDPGSVPKRDAVRLSDNELQAYRYESLKPKGLDQPVTVFTTPTSEGVATLACIAPGPDCEAVANTLKLNKGTAFPVGPSKEYAADLSKQLGALDKKVSGGRAALKSGKTGKAQGKAAHDVGAAYLSASKSLGGLKLSPADQAANAQLADAMKETGTAYRKLGSAAQKGDKGGYASAGKAVAQGEQAISGALRGLQAAGYKVGG